MKGSFWWRNIQKLLDTYKGCAIVNIGDGSTSHLWNDLWDGRLPQQAFPELFSFAKQKNISVQSAKLINDLDQLFRLPLSRIAFEQLQILLEALELYANSQEPDNWTYIWGSHLFSASKAYRHLTGTTLVPASFSWIWKAVVRHKHKTFFWLLLKDRLSTRSLLRRKNMDLPSYSCALCRETLKKVFIIFSYNARLRKIVGISYTCRFLILWTCIAHQLNIPFSWMS